MVENIIIFSFFFFFFFFFFLLLDNNTNIFNTILFLQITCDGSVQNKGGSSCLNDHFWFWICTRSCEDRSSCICTNIIHEVICDMIIIGSKSNARSSRKTKFHQTISIEFTRNTFTIFFLWFCGWRHIYSDRVVVFNFIIIICILHDKTVGSDTLTVFITNVHRIFSIGSSISKFY